MKSGSEEPGSRPIHSSVVTILQRQRIPAYVACVVFVLGVVYTLLWAPVVRHTSAWITPPDFWATYRAAHYVGWGDLGDVYAAHAGVVTFPGILVVLAPVAMLTGAFGWSEGYPITLSHPTAWLVSGPVEILLGSIALFGIDALAVKLGIGPMKRVFVSLFAAVGLWNTVVLWGHPEDAIAVGLTCFAIVALLDGRRAAAGWIFGGAIVMQPLTLLVLPLAVASIGWRRSWPTIWRCVPLSVALLTPPLVSSFGATVRALVEQPNFPNLDHRTPWTNLAPTLSGSGRQLLVAAGPIRLLSVVGACVLAVMLRRRLTDPETLVWGCSVVLLLRCATESVMVAYYLWPLTVFAALLVVKSRNWTVLTALSIGAFLVVLSDWRLSEWPWWAGSISCSIALVALSFPLLKSAPLHDDQIEVVRKGVEHADPAAQRRERAPALVPVD